MKSVLWRLMWVSWLFAIGCGEDASKDTGKDENEGDGSDPEDNSDTGQFGDCIKGHDPANPALLITGFVPTAPTTFAEIADGVQGAIDNGTTIYLFTLEETDDGTTGEIGLGDKPDDDDEYRFKGESESLDIEMDGDDFTSTGEATIDLSIPVLDGDSILVSMHEVVIEGTFEDEHHCAIGEFKSDGPPSEWVTGGTLSGKVTVEETKAATIQIEQPVKTTFSLCAYFAYGLSNAIALTRDPDCEADPSEWNNPPDTTTSDGDDGWLLSADIAATAILME